MAVKNSTANERIAKLETIVSTLGETLHELAKNVDKQETLIGEVSKNIDNKFGLLNDKFSSFGKPDWKLIFAAIALCMTIGGATLTAAILPVKSMTQNNRESIDEINKIVHNIPSREDHDKIVDLKIENSILQHHKEFLTKEIFKCEH